MHAPWVADRRRGGWSVVVWLAVILSGVIVRTVIDTNSPDQPIAFPLAALWLVGAVCAVHWTARRWGRRRG